MNNGTCPVDGCEKPLKRAGYCYGHYMKNWRYGTPTPDHGPKWDDITGRRFGTLVVLERAGEQWRCQCDCGRVRKVNAGDLNRAGDATTCGHRPTHHRKETVGYGAAHGRVRSDRGDVAAMACRDCGSPARHWSYDHDDPDEMVSDDPRTAGIAYSLNPDHYSPRCVPCHKRFDLDRIDSANRLEAS